MRKYGSLIDAIQVKIIYRVGKSWPKLNFSSNIDLLCNYFFLAQGMEEEQKNGDWLRLGQLINSVSANKEVLNLVRKIGNGKLKGQV